MIVVKVGGSLYDQPGLGPGLRAFLEAMAEPVLLVPGGGPFAEAVRHLDSLHRLGEEASHRLALRSMNLGAMFLESLGVTSPILDAEAAEVDVPHSWGATSDSIAARVAIDRQASRLILLKSAEIPRETSWEEAAHRGWVDSCFPTIIKQFRGTVEVVNFRRALDAASS